MSEIFSVGHPETKEEKVHSLELKPRHSFISKVYIRFMALTQALKIIKGLNEAKKIHSGRKRGKSFDQFLKEI